MRCGHVWPRCVLLCCVVQCCVLNVEPRFQLAQDKVCNGKCVQYEEQDAALVPVYIQESQS
jgi:hypothetical protein